jgi:hypothetical protein
MFQASPRNFKAQCLVHNTMRGVAHVLDPSIALPHDRAFYDKEAENEERDLLTDNDHATSSDMSGMSMAHSGDMVSVRVLAATSRLSGDRAEISCFLGC